MMTKEEMNKVLEKRQAYHEMYNKTMMPESQRRAKEAKEKGLI